MKAYISDTEDLKQDPAYQEMWDDMIINVSFSIISTINCWLIPSINLDFAYIE